MKKLFKTIMLLTATSSMFLTSCKKSEDDTKKTADPVTLEITVTSNGATMANNAVVTIDDHISVTFKATGNADNNLKSAAYSVTVNGTKMGDTTLTLSGTSNNFTDSFIIQGPGTYVFSGTLTGASGDPVTVSLTLNAKVYSSVSRTLGNQFDVNQKFYASKNDSTYFLADAKGNTGIQSMIDFAYCSRSAANGGNKLISPNSADADSIYSSQWSATTERITTWTKRNATKFKLSTTIKSADVMAATTQQKIDALIVKGMAEGVPTADNFSVATGQVFMYKTEAGLYGIIYVASADGSGVPATAGAANLIILHQN